MRHTTTTRLTAAASIAGLALLGAACEAEVDEGAVDEVVSEVEQGVENADENVDVDVGDEG